MSAVTKPIPTPGERPGRVSPGLAPFPPEKPSRAKWWILGFVAGAGVGVAWWLSQDRQAERAAPTVVVRTAPVVEETIVRTARITGQTAAKSYATVTAPMLRGPESGRPLILLELVKSGTMVKKGDVLARIDGQSMADHLDDVKATVAEAEADVRKRLAEQSVDMENLRQTLRVAKAEYDKARLEYGAAEVRTEIEQQLLKLAAEEAEARYKQALADVALKEASQRAEIRILEFTVERHKRHRDRHEVDLTRFTIRSPMDGLAVLQSIYRGGGESQMIAQGDQVYPGQVILKVVNPNSMQLEGSVNQAESGEFRLNQTARIRLDAFSGVQLDGKVYSIGALAVGGWRQNYYIRNVPVKVQIAGSDPRLIPDLSASAEVELERAPKSPVVPIAALEREGGRRFVWVKNGQNFERREVQVGLSNGTHVAVRSGLRAGEEVRINN